MNILPSYDYAVSVIVTSYNNRDLVRECLEALLAECARLPVGVAAEVVVVDNASSDGTADMVEREFSNSSIPVRVFRNYVNLGFGGANNRGMEEARGRYLLLLNSDAFFHPGALAKALDHMDANPDAGVGGARLVGRDGSWQPSGRMFHSIWRDAIVLTGLSMRFPHSHVFGAPDRTWANPDEPADVDWVVGAFFLLRREALVKTGLFDPIFFVYCEEVDLCRRVKAADFRVLYWPDVVVTHIGGETLKRDKSLLFSNAGSHVVLWRMRSTLLYYRKNHGWQAWLAYWLEVGFFSMRRVINALSSDPVRHEHAKEFALMVKSMRQAWAETNGGRISPPQPW